MADIGATTTRCALLDDKGHELAPEIFENADFTGVVGVLRVYLDHRRTSDRPTRAALAVAAPIVGDEVQMINIGWRFSQSELKQELNLKRLQVVNDFAAIAWALPLAHAGRRRASRRRRKRAAHDTRRARAGLGARRVGARAHERRLGRHDRRRRSRDDGGGDARGARRHRAATRAFRRTLLGGARAVGARPREPLRRARGARGARSADRRIPRTSRISRSKASRSRARRSACSSRCSAPSPRTLPSRRAHAAASTSPAVSCRASWMRCGKSEFRARFEAKGRYRAYLAAIPTHVITTPLPAFRGLKHLLGYR